MCVLPQEIISLIIGNIYSQNDLYGCALVSKSFYAEAIPRLWRSPFDKNFFGDNSISDSLVINILQSEHQREPPLGHYVRDLYIGEPDSQDTQVNWVRLMPCLEHLWINDTNSLLYEHLKDIFMQCPQITSLRLGEVYFGESEIEDTFKQFPQLTSLSLSGIDPLESITEFTTAIARHCHHLRELDIDLNNDGDLTPDSLVPLLESPLEQLDLWTCNLIDAEKTIKVIKQFNKLKRLNLYDCQGMNQQRIQQMLSADGATTPLPLLTFFSVPCTTMGTYKVDDTTIIPFIQSHPRLETLTMRDCAITDVTLAMIPAALPRLVYLEINGNTGVTAQGVRQLLKACTTLAGINLDGCGLDSKDFPEVRGDTTEIVRWTTSDHPAVEMARMCFLHLNTIKRIRLAPDLGLQNGL